MTETIPTYQELLDFRNRMIFLRDLWGTESNATPSPNQTTLFELCEAFIPEMDEAIEESGGHPGPPYPRVR